MGDYRTLLAYQKSFAQSMKIFLRSKNFRQKKNSG